MSNKGILYGIVAYTLWGFLPLYWRFLHQFPASEILVNRIIWSLLFLVILLTFRRQWNWVKGIRNHPTSLIILVVSATLLAINWFIYIWAVNAGFVVETSLGYFINPLVNVLLGTLFLHEKLRTGQWLSVGIATIGVFYLTITYGTLPWIALSLAFSFGFYGLMKKKVHLGAAESLTSEMAILVLPAMLFLIFLQTQQSLVISQSNLLIIFLLLGTGVVTATPLVFFGAAAKRVPLSTMGLLQYIAPTLQFLIGIFIFREPFTQQSLVGYATIWFALLIYSLEGIVQRRQQLAGEKSITLTE